MARSRRSPQAPVQAQSRVEQASLPASDDDGATSGDPTDSDGSPGAPPPAEVDSDDDKKLFHRQRQQLRQELGNWRREHLDPLIQAQRQLTTDIQTLTKSLSQTRVGRGQHEAEQQTADDISTMLGRMKEGGYVDPDVVGALDWISRRMGNLARSAGDPETARLRSELEELRESSRARDFWQSWHDKPENKGLDGRKLWSEALDIAAEHGYGDSDAEVRAAASVYLEQLAERARANGGSTPAAEAGSTGAEAGATGGEVLPDGAPAVPEGGKPPAGDKPPASDSSQSSDSRTPMARTPGARTGGAAAPSAEPGELSLPKMWVSDAK